jgi:hypothetical protein
MPRRFRQATELKGASPRSLIAIPPDRCRYQLDEQYEEALKYCEQRLQRKIERNGLEAEKQRFGAFGLHRIASECTLSMATKEQDTARSRSC